MHTPSGSPTASPLLLSIPVLPCANRTCSAQHEEQPYRRGSHPHLAPPQLRAPALPPIEGPSTESGTGHPPGTQVRCEPPNDQAQWRAAKTVPLHESARGRASAEAICWTANYRTNTTSPRFVNQPRAEGYNSRSAGMPSSSRSAAIYAFDRSRLPLKKSEARLRPPMIAASSARLLPFCSSMKSITPCGDRPLSSIGWCS